MVLKNKFREKHLFNILHNYENTNEPLDRLLCNYFRATRAIGSKDRRFISNTVYGMVRWQALFDHLCEKPTSWEKRYIQYQQKNPLDYISQENIPLHIRAGFPKWLFEKICQSYSEAEAVQICLSSNFPAPTTIRANLLKTSREELIKILSINYPLSPCEKAPHGIVFKEKINFFTLDEFKNGLFEVQDEGSQLIAELVTKQNGTKILDFCSGSGGKTLAFAPYMQGKGQIYLHDIRENALKEAQKRLCRAGIQNAQCIIASESDKLDKIKGHMDVVLVDAPCSGTGTLRRNPDMKWKLSPTAIENLVNEQRSIVKKAMEFLKPNGKLIYATCSLLKEENENQIDYFNKEFNLKMLEPVFKSVPARGEMDGFFAAVLSLGA